MNFFARLIKCRALISRSKYLPSCVRDKLSKILSYAMSQKSILSFFKVAEQNGVKNSKSKPVVKSSPVKNVKKEKESHCIENADKISLYPNKVLNGESSKFSDDEKKISNKSPKKDEKSVELNGDIALEKKNEMNGVENGENTKLPHSPEKDTSECKDDTFADKKDIVSPIEAIEKQSTSPENNTLILPKRKTARKQMSSGSKNYSKQENVTSTDKDVESKNELKSNETQKNEVVEKETKENCNTASVSENKETTKDADKPSDVKQSENKITINVAKKAKDSPLKKSVKKESIHSFFNSVKSDKESSDTKVKKDESLPMETDDSPIKKEDDDSKERIKDEENDDSPLKVVKKRKLQLLESDDESSPVKKSVKIKIEDNCSKKKKREVKTSPKEVKKLKFENTSNKKEQKKAKRLESDDENKESIKSPIKNETASTKVINTPSLSEEKEDLKEKVEQSSSNEASEAKNSPSATLGDSVSKPDKEKKFAVKSTSATDTVYNPAKNNYHPIDDAFWKRNEKTPYLALAKTLELIENTSGRLKTIEILANFFRSVMVLSPDDFLHSIYLCLNRVAPEYEGIEMGVGETLLMKAVAQATGRTVDKIKAEVAVKGDLGLVSESSRGNQRVMFAPPKLTISAVFHKFREIAEMSGNAAMSKKIDKIKGLFVACRDCEAKYIIRSLSGKLRIGLAEQSILSAISRAAVLTPGNQAYPPEIINASDGMSPSRFKEFLDSRTLILKTAYCECPNYDLIVPVLLKEGISALPDHCQLSPGVPLKPMLAHPTAGVDIVLARFDKNAFTCEFKYDGERAQIHRNDKGVTKIFSRNQEDNTSKYPDIISLLPEVLNESTKSFILDSEAVAYDREKKQILPFQVLSTRKRKDAVESEITVQVCVMAFDLLYLNGESLVKKPLKERRSLLHSSFNEIEGKFMFALYRDGDNAETMQEFLDESVKGNCEGLMVKALEVDASYEIAKRSHNWLKLKKDYLQGIGDTLDLVVIGGYFGKGKRTGNYGGFLLACYDGENEEFQSICKLGTGFKDDSLEAHTKFLKQHVIKEPKKYYSYDSGLEPDEWFEPVQVWEIKCADLSISPVHRAAIGIVDPKKGISLRFPRFVKIREDKSVEDATSASQIADMYRNQQQIQNTSNSNSNIEEDYY